MELNELQKQLDEKKYFESQVARQDLSGKMFYCETCIFKSKEQTCELTNESRVANCVCARQEQRRLGGTDENKTNRASGVKSTTRKPKSKK